MEEDKKTMENRIREEYKVKVHIDNIPASQTQKL